jgi:hypothetical protein
MPGVMELDKPSMTFSNPLNTFTALILWKNTISYLEDSENFKIYSYGHIVYMEL